MPTAPLLQRFVDDELARASALIQQTLDDTVELLRSSKDSGLAPAERAIQVELIDKLERHALAYRATFVESLQSRVADDLARQDGGSGMAPPSGLGGLTLMDESRIEIEIEVSRATQLIDAMAEWELRELQAFTSTLVGQAHVSAESNPLRPTLYATALWDAGCVVHPDQPQRAALLRAAAAACAALLKKAWAAASSRLEHQGVTPSIYRTVVLAGGSSIASRPGPRPPSSLPPVASLDQLLSAMPAGHELLIRAGAGPGGGGRGGGGTRGDAGVATPSAAPVGRPAPIDDLAFEQALLKLDDILRQLPGRAVSKADAVALSERMAGHRAALADSARVSRERQVIALLSRIFDAMLSDAELHPAFVAPVARLQVSALRAARGDPSMVESTQHPIWQLLDRIGEAGSAYPRTTDPRGAALAKLCGRLADGLTRSTAPDADLYRKALAKLDGFLDAQLQAQLRAADSSVQALRDAEKVQALQGNLRQRLSEQMEPMRPSASVRQFIGKSWSRVLATALLRFGDEAPVTKGYVRLVDDLLWSVQLPDHPASRQRLVGLLPGLLQRLRAGMTLIALPYAEQAAILAELNALHAAALRPPEAATSAEPTSRQIVESLRDEVVAPAAPAPGGALDEPLIDLESMQTVPAGLLDTESKEGAAEGAGEQEAAALHPPQRQRMFVNGRWAVVQLLWRSDHGHYFLFAGEMPAQTHSITHHALARLAAVGLLRPLEVRSLSQRALDKISRQLQLATRESNGDTDQEVCSA